MKETTKAKGQQQGHSNGSITELFRDYLAASVREALWDLMEQEVELLCGASHRRGESVGSVKHS